MARKLDQTMSVAVNARYRVHTMTGIQRYAHEIVSRLSDAATESGIRIEAIAPTRAKGAAGHLWEQTTLPSKAAGRLLWSPSGCGPLLYTRQVVTFHDLFPLENPEWYSRKYGIWYRLMMKQLAKRALHLIAVSEYTQSSLIRLLGCAPVNITVIPNGLTENIYRTNTEAITNARNALGVPTARYVLSVSSLVPRKNLKGILNAWARVQSQVPEDVWLVLAGAKADSVVYGASDRPLDVPRVHYTGYVPDDLLAGLYSGASLFLFPSLAEGFGLPLLEAMACGVRSITSNNTSLPEVGGDLVRYVDPLKTDDIAAAIHHELASGATWERPFHHGIERAKLFSWDKAAQQTLDVLNKVLLRESGTPVGVDRLSLNV
jgi:glycosyltransferase involved in cell wall biosynthesis